MVRKGKKDEDDDEMELEEDEDGQSDDEDIDFELDLPDILVNISLREKRELLEFKRTHNEKEWEEEMLRRQDALARRIDMERLQRLAKAGGEGTVETAKRAGAKSKAPPSRGRTSAAAANRRKRRVDDSDEEEGEYVEEEEEEEAPSKKRRSSRISSGGRKKAADDDEDDDEDYGKAGEDSDDDFAAADDDSDDDLFDSDEEEAISSNKYKKGGASAAAEDGEDDDDVPTTSKGRLTSKRSSAARAREEEDEDARFAAKSAAKSAGKKAAAAAAAAAADDDDSDGEGDWLEKEEKGDRDRRGSRGGARDADMDVDQEEAAEEAEDSPEAQLVDYLKIQIRRTTLKKWLSEPYFENAVKGLFVRVFAGMATVKGPVVDGPDGPTDTQEVAIYRMAEIVGVERGGRAYKVDQSDTMTTTTRLTLAVGHHVKHRIKISDVSSKRLQQLELERYLEAIRGSRVHKPLSQKQVLNRREAAKKASNHQYTHKEINEMIHKKHGLKFKAITTNESNAMLKLELDLKKAQAEKDYDKLEEVQKAIESLKRDIEKNRELAHKMSVKQVSVNKRNKMANFKKDLDAGVRKRQQDDALSKGLAVTALMDPFIRRETRPKILWNTGVQRESSGDSKAEGDDEKAKKAAAAAAVEAAKKEEKERQEKQRDEQFFRLNRLSLDEVRARVKARLGVDPIEVAKEDRRDRYLRKVCAGLPPQGSQARERLRKGISLTEWTEQMTRET